MIQTTEYRMSDTTTTTEAPLMNEFGFVLKNKPKAAKTAATKAAKTPKAPKAPKAPRVTKESRAFAVYEQNKKLSGKDLQAKIAAELGVSLERAYGYTRLVLKSAS